MKRLFHVVFPSGKHAALEGSSASFYFSDKKEAKAFRDSLNVNAPEHAKVHVALGPDHDRYGKAGQTRPGRSHRHNESIGDGFPKKRK